MEVRLSPGDTASKLRVQFSSPLANKQPLSRLVSNWGNCAYAHPAKDCFLTTFKSALEVRENLGDRRPATEAWGDPD